MSKRFCKIFVAGLVLENPSMYLQELCQEVHHTTSKQVTAPTVFRLLARYGSTRKKVAKQRGIALRAEFTWMSSYSRKFLVWAAQTIEIIHESMKTLFLACTTGYLKEALVYL